ncbi:e1-E2 ATPase [Opisthorchis viverrini]|uniref:E1-E2 ATPase n=1 Tax=Opisthorchis viverrini TaxID=6198 RepID=A0A1S8X3G0_OPIVI|nr:e1-E2 ATPase [Opisthorchis viverrini]
MFCNKFRLSTFVSVTCFSRSYFTAFQQVNSTELVPGDIIEIPRKGCTMHCDAFVLNGNCIVNESTLTGESVPVTKTPLPERQRKNESFNLPSLSRHVLFGGTCVIQTRNFNNEAVLALVVRTGFRTAKGELVRSILYPKPMKFKFTEDAIKFVLAMGVLALIGMPISIYFMYRAQVETSSLVMRTLDLITIVVSPALPMAMTVGIVFAQRRLRAIDIYCINPGAITVCGVINIACFDKIVID